MAFGYVLIAESTYGGLYYTANFTATGTQPVWTKITTTGLPGLDTLDTLAVCPFNPLNRQFVYSSTGDGEIYARNGGNWTKVLDLTIAKAVFGLGDNDTQFVGWIYCDPTIEGKIISWLRHGLGHYVMVSLDYGATWASSFKWGTPVSNDGTSLGESKSLGTYYWNGAQNNIGLPTCVARYSPDSGVTRTRSDVLYAASTGAPVLLDRNDPTIAYTYQANGGLFDLAVVDGDSGNPMTVTVLQAYIADRLGGTVQRGDSIWIDPYNSAHMRILSAYDGLANPTIKSTSDTWATLSTGTALGYGKPGALTHIQNTGDTTAVVLGDYTGGATVKIATLSTETDYSPEARDGANAASAPYTDSVPRAGTLANYGIWVGQQPASKGVYVYADEQESADSAWSSDIADYALLGSPMGGDRSSFRDMPADGFDVYHAEDVHAATPQIHAPWDETSPPGAGYGIISDGAKWEVSSDTIALSGDLHDAVTLDADAAVILDLNGQEIGLDVQNANTVLAGPTTGVANEPTFRALAMSNGDLSDVITAGVVANDILKYDGSDWVDGRVSLDELSDVDTTGADAYDILRFNGATWADGRHNIRKRTAITSDTTLDDSYDFVTVDATGGDVTVTLPSLTAAIDGLEYAIKRIDASANTVTIMPLVTYLVDDSGDFLIDDNGDFLIDGNSTNVEGAIDGIDLSSLSSMQVAADLDENSWWII